MFNSRLRRTETFTIVFRSCNSHGFRTSFEMSPPVSKSRTRAKWTWFTVQPVQYKFTRRMRPL